MLKSFAHRVESIRVHANKRKLEEKIKCSDNIEKIRSASRAYSKEQYTLDPDKKKSASSARSKKQYKAKPSPKNTTQKTRTTYVLSDVTGIH